MENKMKAKDISLLLLLGQIVLLGTTCFEGLGIISETLSGIVFVLLSGISIILLVRKRMLFTPLLFPYTYLAFFGLYQLKLRTDMTDMQFGGKLTIVSCMFIWVLMCCCTKEIHFDIPQFQDFRFNRKRFLLCVTLLSMISIAAMLYEWKLAGGIPALRNDAETFRMSVSQSGAVHIMAIMIKIVAVLIEAYWISSISTKQKKSKWLLLLFGIALFMMWGTANRGELLFIPVLGIIMYWLKYPPKFKKVFFIAVIGILVIAAYPAIRGYGLYGISYFTQYSAISRVSWLGWFMPLYGTLAYNFEILNRLFYTFPSIVEYGFGNYSIFVYIPFFDFGEELWVVQNRVWNTNFYGALTSTYLGTWYADFGFFGCFLATILICWILLELYKRVVIKKNFKALVLYAYFFYISLVGTYSNAFSFVTISYLILIYFVMAFCEEQKNRKN